MSVSDLHYPGNAAAQPRPLPAVQAGISLWWCPLTADDAAFETLATWLSAMERERAARYGRPDLARQYTIGRAALRWVLARRLDVPPPAVQIERGERGRPRLSADGSFDFNVSNTRGIALIGVCETSGVRIGLDLEHAERSVNHAGLARRVLTAREKEAMGRLAEDRQRGTFLRLWTCKEAMSKATGDALSAPFRRMDVGLLPSLALLDGPAPYLPQQWALAPVDVPDGFIGTLAVWRRFS